MGKYSRQLGCWDCEVLAAIVGWENLHGEVQQRLGLLGL